MGPKSHLCVRQVDGLFEVAHATADMWPHAEFAFAVWASLVLAPPVCFSLALLAAWYLEHRFHTVSEVVLGPRG